MRNRILLVVFLASIIVASSCTQRIYTSATSFEPVTQVPLELKEKGDISLEAALERFDATNSWGYDESSGQSVLYNFLSTRGLNVRGHYALSDKFSIGLGYKFNTVDLYKGHVFSPSVNYFENYTTKKGKATYGYDILSGLQYKVGKNFMSVDEVVVNQYFFYQEIPIEDSLYLIPGVYYDYSNYPLGYYTIQQQYLRWFVQPSFSVQHRLVSFHLGASFAFQHQHVFKSSLQEQFQDFLVDEDLSNPLVYYNRNKTTLMGEAFWAFGLGPEVCRIVFRQGLGWTTDKYQSNLFHFGIGLQSNFNLKKK